MRYFAYGSNMDPEQMQERCPSAKFQTVVELPDYKFQVNSRGVATVVPARETRVFGALWELSEDDVVRLDECQGMLAGFYHKESVSVRTVSGQEVEAFTYIATDDTLGEPDEAYLDRVTRAAAHHGLPAQYVEHLRSWLAANRKKPKAPVTKPSGSD
jgi:gamma-glutamylcyclotransferase (GGCT)/AIG2-like uncharacterized protein YtfP